MIRVDRTKVSAYEAFQLDRCAANARKRRERNRAAGLCVNENLRGTHGKAARRVMSSTNDLGNHNKESHMTVTATAPKKPERAAPTAIDALTKIQRILAQLSDEDRKRVIAFLNS